MSSVVWESMLSEARAVAARVGFALRPFQEEVLFHLAHGRHVFAGLPTGYGKSACYWVPARAWGWKVWVVSPLVSLIEDQALACERLGVRALSLRSVGSRAHRTHQRALLEAGAWQVCFLSPERLEMWARSGYLSKLHTLGLGPDLVVIDEMHCLEEWRSFRPAYGTLFEGIKNWLSRDSLLLGLSASMPLRESRAWMEELCGEYEHVASGLERENLYLTVVCLEEEGARWLLLLSVLRELRAPESALVYCGTRREADEVSRWLRSCGVSAVAYHAGLPSTERSARTKAFRAGNLRVVCATTAFGMGIDYPHVTRVVHFSMPHDLESYWQEVGRAGRSGARAYAVAFWRRSEVTRLRAISDPAAKERFCALWKAWLSGACRKRVIAAHLGIMDQECGSCDCCSPGGDPLLNPPPARAWWAEAEALSEGWFEEKMISFLAGRYASALSTR